MRALSLICSLKNLGALASGILGLGASPVGIVTVEIEGIGFEYRPPEGAHRIEFAPPAEDGPGDVRRLELLAIEPAATSSHYPGLKIQISAIEVPGCRVGPLGSRLDFARDRFESGPDHVGLANYKAPRTDPSKLRLTQIRREVRTVQVDRQDALQLTTHLAEGASAVSSDMFVMEVGRCSLVYIAGIYRLKGFCDRAQLEERREAFLASVSSFHEL